MRGWTRSFFLEERCFQSHSTRHHTKSPKPLTRVALLVEGAKGYFDDGGAAEGGGARDVRSLFSFSVRDTVFAVMLGDAAVNLMLCTLSSCWYYGVVLCVRDEQ